tara:strand:- start:3043 stop:3516 length:474 start_codon:yes stop_codon:yes gene_type:complete
MLRYWSVWNFIWWAHHELNNEKFENPLKLSIVITSVIGGSFIYIYPRAFTLRIIKYKYKIPYIPLIIGDLIIHQLPMYRMIKQNHTSNVCGRYLLLPTLLNILISKVRKINKNEIYDINFNRVMQLSYGSFMIFSLISHKKTINNILQKKLKLINYN